MKRHPIDLVSLTAGVLVLGTAVILMNPDADVQSLWQFAPLGLVAFGLALLVSAVTRVRGGSTTPAPAGVDDSSSRRAEVLTEEQLIRDSLGHFGSDHDDTDLLFGSPATGRTGTLNDDTEALDSTDDPDDLADTSDVDTADVEGSPEPAATERLSHPAGTSPPHTSAEDDDR